MGQLSRRLTPMTLFLLSMNGLVGSGWLFAPLYAAKIAGSAAIISWIIGGSASILIALTFAEISTMIPVAGGTAHIPQLSHGTFVSFIFGWIAWITALMLAPIEVQAVLQYAAIFFPSLMHQVGSLATLTLWGYLWAAILMVGLCVVNIFSYKGLVRFNFILCTFKLAVMVLTIFAITHAHFNITNFSDLSSSMQSMEGWQAILSAVATSGIVLAFSGFKSGVDLAGETKISSLAIPLSTVGSVVVCLLLYLGLQVCFIGALDPASFKGGWQNLSFTGDIGPFLGLAAGLGLIWLVNLLYINSVVSPLGAGLVYVTVTARILYAMSRIGYVPKFLSKVNRQHLPVYAIMVNFVFGMLSFLPLPGWQAMVNFLISTIVITYAMGPIALICFRRSLPDKHRLFRLPFANTLCLVAFYVCNLFSYWTGWGTISKLALVLMVGIGLFFIAYFRGVVQIEKKEFKAAIWIAPYLLGLVIISYLGAFGGGQNIIPFGFDFLIIALFSVGIFELAIGSRAKISSEDLAALLLSESLGTAS